MAALNVWKKDMPDESQGVYVLEGGEAIQVSVEDRCDRVTPLVFYTLLVHWTQSPFVCSNLSCTFVC